MNYGGVQKRGLLCYCLIFIVVKTLKYESTKVRKYYISTEYLYPENQNDLVVLAETYVQNIGCNNLYTLFNEHSLFLQSSFFCPSMPVALKTNYLLTNGNGKETNSHDIHNLLILKEK